MKRRIEVYFEHKWDQGRNFVFMDGEYQQFQDQLPDATKDKMLVEFLFVEFIKFYNSTMFDIPMSGGIQHARYTWEKPDFREFMYESLVALEPIRYEAGTIVMDELEDISSIVFIIDSEYHIGVSIDRVQKFKIKMKNQDIGAYGMTMGHKCEFIYKTSKACDGYFIRHRKWMPIIENPDLEEVVEKVKEKLTSKYQFLERSMKLLKKHELAKIKSNTVIQLTNNPEFIIDYLMMKCAIKDK